MKQGKAFYSRNTKEFEEYMFSIRWRHKIPHYSDFEFCKLENSYIIQYIADNDKVFLAFVDSDVFNALITGINLERNPFGDKNSDCTPDFIWKIIVAYCHIYGKELTKAQAKERMNDVYFVESDANLFNLAPAERISRESLKFESNRLSWRTDALGRFVHWEPELINDANKEVETKYSALRREEKAYIPSESEGFKEYMDYKIQGHGTPQYRDFEFYKAEFGYCIQYIAEKDKVYSVSIDGGVFDTLITGINLERNPFDDKESDMTPYFIWQIIAAYCRTYGSKLTKKEAKERLNMPYCIEKDGSTRHLAPAELISRERLKLVSDWRSRLTDVFGRPVRWIPELINNANNEVETVYRAWRRQAAETKK